LEDITERRGIIKLEKSGRRREFAAAVEVMKQKLEQKKDAIRVKGENG
jgi:hypothetical protein